MIRRKEGKWIITKQMLEEYEKFLTEEEKETGTVKQYTRNVKALADYMGDDDVTKKKIIIYKKILRSKYRTSTTNAMIVAVNSFFKFMGWNEFCVKTVKVQKEVFLPENREITQTEYKRLVETAKRKGNDRLAMVMMVLCVLGIRISELKAVTVEAVQSGTAVVYNKGKERYILIPRSLQVELKRYIRKNGLKEGYVFCTASKGKALDRSYIWREMKKLCGDAGVNPDKVFPHNLRRLFARVFYDCYKDIVKLADILGHSSIETTRIYLRESFNEHRKQLENMNLLIMEEKTRGGNKSKNLPKKNKNPQNKHLVDKSQMIN